MISKRKAFIITALAVIVAVVITVVGTSFIGIRIDDRVLISTEQYDSFVELKNKYSKTEYLEKYIEDNFLYEVQGDLQDGSLRGMMETLEDPYSEYLNVESMNSLIEQTSGEYSGIGIYVSISEDNKIIVISPIEDTPAEKAGLKTGDKIIKVNGQEFTGEEMTDAVKVMKGKPGTEVTITVEREKSSGELNIFDLTIERANIKIQTVKYGELEEDIGYIRITTFDDPTSEDFKKALVELTEEKEVKGLVLDLRFNPGGLLDSVVDIADELLGKTVITYTQTKSGEREYYNSGRSKVDIPLVVLINGGSASASEILAGAVKDTERGILVGDKSFGKGIVQRIIPLEDGSGFKLTVSEYFTPDNINIHGIGIEPDVSIDLNEKSMEEGLYGMEYYDEDNQLQKAVEILNRKLD
ncbi:MAG: S41 family peptidase [Eubacteriales bacterium]